MKDISIMKDNQSSVPFGLQIENGDLKLITGSKCVAQNAHLYLILPLGGQFDNISLGYNRDLLISPNVDVETKKNYTRAYLLNIEFIQTIDILSVIEENRKITLKYEASSLDNDTIENEIILRS